MSMAEISYEGPNGIEREQFDDDELGIYDAGMLVFPDGHGGSKSVPLERVFTVTFDEDHTGSSVFDKVRSLV